MKFGLKEKIVLKDIFFWGGTQIPQSFLMKHLGRNYPQKVKNQIKINEKIEFSL